MVAIAMIIMFFVGSFFGVAIMCAANAASAADREEELWACKQGRELEDNPGKLNGFESHHDHQ